MKKILMNVMIVLCFFMSQPLFAGAESTQFTMTPRAQKIFDQAPQTPEALLKVVKEFLDTPMMNGYEFVERISGVDRQHLGPEKRWKTAKGVEKKMYEILCPKCPYDQGVGGKRELPTPYIVHDIEFKPDDDQIISVGISFRIGRQPLSSMTFLVTPVIIRDFFGKPTGVYVTPASSEYSPGLYYLRYSYDIEGGFELGMTFLAKGDDDPDLKKQRWKHTAEQIREERNRRKEFANHKDFIALGLGLNRQH